MATNALIPAMAAATKNGSRSSTRAAMPPIVGPATKPTPKAAPRSPKRRARSRGGVMSATAAWATDTLAPETPSTMRPTNSRARDPARPVSSVPAAVPTRERMSTGLRPTRSEIRPHTGAKTSWATENDANMAPTVKAPA